MHAVADKHILIVEDEVLIGEVVADLIAEAGGRPLGPVLSEQEAVDLLRYGDCRPDAAVLDLREHGTASALADRLHALGVPFVFAAVTPAAPPAAHGDRPVCRRPYLPSELIGSLGAALN